MSETKTKPAPSFAPVYAAACYPEFAEIARKHGYALAVHGSLARDFDLIAIPWTEKPGTPDEVLDELTATFAVKRIGDWSDKPHGRRAFTLSVGFGQCAIDLQFMPTADALADALAAALADHDRQPNERM